MKQPLVSIIITTKNSEKTLRSCLQSCKEQSYKQIEIIVVDNYSADETQEIANQFTNLVFLKRPERSAQRNVGIEKSRGEYLLFLDSDMSITPNLIQEAVEIMSSKKFVGLYIPEKIKGNSYWAQVRNFERSFYNRTVIDAVRFVKRSDAIKLEGFDESMYAGEDWDFDKRIRRLGKTFITKNVLIHDERNFSVAEYVKKKTYYSGNLEVYKNKWQGDREVEKQFSPYYRYVGVFISQGKWKKIFKRPDLAAGMFLLRFAVGFAYLFVILSKPFVGKINPRVK